MGNFYVYIVASISRTLYIGVTGDLSRRIAEHKSGALPGFSHKYRTTKLVYYERHSSPDSAIAREKQLKRWRREKKVHLIEMDNTGWRDLSAELGE